MVFTLTRHMEGRVEPDLLQETRLAGRSGYREIEPQLFSLDIEIDEKSGSFRVYDPRVFHEGRRGFCRRLIEATARHPGVSKAEIDLASASCRIDFGSGPTTSDTMADAFADAVHQAASADSHKSWIGWLRPSRPWSAMAAYSHDGDASLWEIVEVKPGASACTTRCSAARRPSGPPASPRRSTSSRRSARYLRPWSHNLTIDLRRESPVDDRFLDKVERRFEVLMASETARARLDSHTISEQDDTIEVATGLKRLKYLALAGGAFVMTLGALVVPGLPTVPFLMATSYYLARSSPRLDAILRRTAFFGPILSEWEQQHGLSRLSKGKLMGLTIAIVVVTVTLATLAPVALIVMLVFMSTGIFAIYRMPALPEERQPKLRLLPPSLVLPAPTS